MTDTRQPATLNMLSLNAVGPTAVVKLVAQRRGLFARRDVAVSFVPVQGVQVPELSDQHPMGHIGAPAALLNVAAGRDLRILLCLDSARLTHRLVVRPEITTAKALRGRRLGARVPGAALWIHTVMALEQLGLDPARDDIAIPPIGDAAALMAALEDGTIDGAVLPVAASQHLAARGFSVLLDLAPLGLHGAPDALVATPAFLQMHPETVKAVVQAMIEAAAFVRTPEGMEMAKELIVQEFGLTNAAAAQEGVTLLVQGLAQNPAPSLERLRAMQRVMARAVPEAAGVDVGRLIQEQAVLFL